MGSKLKIGDLEIINTEARDGGVRKATSLLCSIAVLLIILIIVQIIQTIIFIFKT